MQSDTTMILNRQLFPSNKRETPNKNFIPEITSFRVFKNPEKLAQKDSTPLEDNQVKNEKGSSLI